MMNSGSKMAAVRNFLTAMLLLVCMCLCLVSETSYAAVSTTPLSTTGTISTSCSYYASPSSSSKKIGKLSAKTVVSVSGRTSSNWYLIQYSGKTGYVSSKYVRLKENTLTGAGLITATCNVRQGDTTAYAVVKTPKKGTEVAVLASTPNGWYRVRIGTKTGYVGAKYVSMVKTTALEESYIVTNYCSVRTGDTTQYSLLGTIDKGTPISVTGITSNQWLQFTFNGKTGYLNSKYAKTNPSVDQLNISALSKVATMKKTSYFYTDSNGKLVSSGQVPKSTVVSVTGQNEDWYQVLYGDREGYVMKSALQFNTLSNTAVWKDGWLQPGSFPGLIIEDMTNDSRNSEKTYPLYSYSTNGKPNKILLHSTEGNTNGKEAYPTGSCYPSHFTIDLKKRTVSQHFSINRPALGIIGDKPAGIQIEIVGFEPESNRGGEYNLKNMSDEDWDYLTLLLQEISKQTGIPLTSTVNWNSKNLSASAFEKYTGILGHQHGPRDVHVDPGNIWPMVSASIKRKPTISAYWASFLK